MVCLGLEPGVAGWKVQTNPLSYGGTPYAEILIDSMVTLSLLTTIYEEIQVYLERM